MPYVSMPEVTLVYDVLNDEYQVPEKNGELYHTSDLLDATDTLRRIWGEHVSVNLKVIS